MFIIEWRLNSGHPWSHLEWVMPNYYPTREAAEKDLAKYIADKKPISIDGWPFCEYRVAPQGDTVINPPKHEKRSEVRNRAMESQVDFAIGVLNELLRTDEQAITALVEHRVTANAALADHPTAQVMVRDHGPRIGPCIGMLGVINAIFGADENGYGYIGVEHDGRRVLRFVRVQPPKMG